MNNTNKPRYIIGDNTPNKGVFLSDNHQAFLSLLPKELTIEHILANPTGGSMSVRDYNGNLVPFNVVQPVVLF
jgi:hypothetical protein